MTKYAVVDLEATDAHSTSNKIIQIGIVIVEDGQIIETYSTEVNPHEPLDLHIQQLTGLTDVQLADAPDFIEVADEVYQLLKDKVFVAHNAKFDFELMEKSFTQLGLAFACQRVDTVDLVRVFYPDFERYSLETLSENFNLNHENPHEALSDAYATAQLLIQIQEKIRRLPLITLEEILRHSEALLYETRLVLEDELESLSLKNDDFLQISNIATKRIKSIENKNLVSNNFEKNLELIGLETRKKQAELAQMVEAELEKSTPTFIEAGTGIGKTYGYLLPLLAKSKKIILSTPTKALQNQVLIDVAPKLEDKFSVLTAKIVGRKNYISLEKFSKILQNQFEGKNFEIFKMKVLVWLTETTTGELDELSKTLTNDEYFNLICHDGEVFEGQQHYEQDFWLIAQERARKAQIKVVNHAYLIERLADHPEQFLGDSVLVIDEGQQLFHIMENLKQKSVQINESLIKIDKNETVKKRLVESLIFQLAKKELDREKLLMDSRELGLDDWVDLLEKEDIILWKDGNILYSSEADFYNFASLVPESTKLYLLGAGLALSEKNPQFPELLGFKNYQFLKIPIKKVKNQELLIVNDGPFVQNTSIINYAHYLADKVAELAAGGLPIIVLFTSKISLTFTAEQLSSQGYSVLAQGISGDASQIKKKFDKNEGQILLGLGSFWEGIDFDKQDELILVIPRLPFATPDDILTKKYSTRFKNPFYDFNVPMATLKTRQAIGRVNRRANQKSKIIVLDQRLAGKSYAKKMTKNLSKLLPIKVGNFSELLKRINQQG